MLYGLTFFAALIYIGNAISCYECNSGPLYNGTDCGDPVNKDKLAQFLTTCSSEYSLCRKMTQNVEGTSSVIRSCATSGRVNQCYGRTGTANIKLEYCECNANECNSAPSMLPALSFTLCVLGALLLSVLTH